MEPARSSRRQSSFERRVVCAVCLSPRLEMVTGICQHRFCTACVYTSAGKLRTGLSKCPTCQMEQAFPQKRPIIPEDIIEMQRNLGITDCTNPDCEENMWTWELEGHLEVCSSKKTPQRECSKENAVPATDPRPNRIGARELNSVLSAPRSLRQTAVRRGQTLKVRLCSVSTTFSMRYPLRTVNR